MLDDSPAKFNLFPPYRLILLLAAVVSEQIVKLLLGQDG